MSRVIIDTDVVAGDHAYTVEARDRRRATVEAYLAQRVRADDDHSTRLEYEALRAYNDMGERSASSIARMLTRRGMNGRQRCKSGYHYGRTLFLLDVLDDMRCRIMCELVPGLRPPELQIGDGESDYSDCGCDGDESDDTAFSDDGD